MVRPHIAVWRAAPSDSSTVADLWIASAMAGGMNPDLAARAAAGTRVAEALERPGVQVLVADLEGKPAGIAVVGTRFDGLLDAPNLAVDELFVMPAARRHGVGRQLMAAVARLAESEGYALVFAHVPSADKASNRLLARLGFGISVTRRVVPTAVLRRKLTVGDEPQLLETVTGRGYRLREPAGVG